MSQHSFGVSLPLTQVSAYANLLNGLVTANIPTPNVDLYGSVYQYYRGVLGANLIGVNVNVDNVNVASANINVGYNANYTYDQHLSVAPPPNFPTPANPTWVQTAFAEIPTAKLPSGF